MVTKLFADERQDPVAVAIIGAGPYGLSIAAHFNARKIPYRIFGTPMAFWSKQMPPGMKLKSEGFASSLFEPEGKFTLEEYCREQGLPYAPIGLSVPLETFIAYGIEFQKRFVPTVERREVISVARSGEGFVLELDNSEKLTARNIVVAVGIAHFSYVPPVLAHLIHDKVSHSSEYGPIDQFPGKRVAIVGSGSSASDLAVLLKQAGAHVQMFCRRSSVEFQSGPKAHRSLIDRLWHPLTPIGGGIKLNFYAYAPQLFRLFPEEWRLRKVKKLLGPLPTWWTKEQIVGKIPMHLGTNISSVEKAGEEAVVTWEADGVRNSQPFDHVIAATGYQMDIKRLSFLSPEIVASLKMAGNGPELSSHFESSIPGLYFVGITASTTFGPLLRFACGAGFAAKTLSRKLARVLRNSKYATKQPVGVA